jgi:hypothetical protein
VASSIHTRKERGATATEAALVAPLFIALLFGIVETSVYLLDVNAIRNATRISAHEGANSARDSLADYNLIKSSLGALSGMANRVDGIVVFKAANPGDVVPSACVDALNNHDAGVPGRCNVYAADQISALDPLHFGYAVGSNEDATLWDRNWPATGRRDSLSGTTRPDLLGVYVRVKHRSLTGVLPTKTLVASVINEIEPQRAE